jgi:glycosyltransferase involved in cell wall biosynthesis
MTWRAVQCPAVAADVRVLLVARQPLPGDAVACAVEALASHAAVTVATPDGPTAQRARRAGADVQTMPEVSGVRLVRWLRAAAGECGAHALHAETLSVAVPVALAARSARLPVVWQLREIVPAAGEVAGMAAASLLRWAPRLPHAVLASSRVALESVPGARGGRVVPEPVVDPPMPPTPPWGPIRRVGVLGPVGTEPLEVEQVVEGVARAFATDPQVELVVLGPAPGLDTSTGRRLPALLQVWHLTGRVRFLGADVDTVDTLATLDVLLDGAGGPQPFRREVVQAMRLGVPVVVTEGTAAADIVTDDVDGLVVPARTPSALGFALLRLDLEPGLRSRLADAALRTSQAWSPAEAARATLAAYEDVLRAR